MLGLACAAGCGRLILTSHLTRLLAGCALSDGGFRRSRRSEEVGDSGAQ